MFIVIVQGVNAEVEIKSGDPITVTTDDQYQEACTNERLWLDYKNIVQVIEPGKRILIDDGNLSLVVQEKGQYIDKLARIQSARCFGFGCLINPKCFRRIQGSP